MKAKSPLISDLVKQINDGSYNQINRFWEATPPEIAEAAVDELGNFMLHPETYRAGADKPAGARRQGLGCAEVTAKRVPGAPAPGYPTSTGR